MGKISKNARTDRGLNKQEKNMVKVIKPIKSKKGTYSFQPKIVHKDDVKSFLSE